MADEAAAPVATEPAATTEIPTRPVDAAAEPAVAKAKPSEGDAVIATEGVAEVPEKEEPEETATAKQETTADATTDAAAASNETDAAPAAESAAEPAADASATNGTATTPAKKSKNGKRKSAGGMPEHKAKKTPAKSKKKAPELRLDAQPGDMYMVAMRGYQPWPVIVCDEEMLPESLLSKRPVSAKRIDGTYREDFLEGGKNAKDRRYPIMFLGTNEFAWQVNTELLTFDVEDVKKDVEAGNSAKKNKALWSAYEIAAEGHDLAYFKTMLASHEAALQEDAEAREAKEAEKKERKEKAAKRKSSAAAGSDDMEMEDAGDDAALSAKKAKATKKRKKEDDSDGGEPAAKTPKTTKLKLNNKTPKEGSAVKPKKETKSKKKASEEATSAQPEEPPMTEEERLVKREKQILYLRHRLQKGFLSRDQAPKDEDMTSMADYLKQLEQHEDLEADIIKKTKVHKVLKAIIKLDNIPKEEVHSFKSRSTELLSKWNGALATADRESAEKTTPAATNGVKADDEKSESAKADTPAVEKKEETTEEDREGLKEEPKDETTAEPTEEKDEAPKEEAPAESATAAPADKDGDVSMADVEATKEAPAIIDAPNPEGVNAATTESTSETAAPTTS
ncbi:uncharacterized protein M421DRAFT_54499 [Didymella exigua CBS 183.55]|uniref:PWWP domain-containing protein n=1 Tax=Didymella exigua CBS 183.55 TaxID=1150837 RepID=A0A6A5RYK9_9PLEO|nr:uncharacterized protein M421DRAFT_54499 [Didymella exigua CBS 183.55]KAF1932440.1 hypothetical protein M421DRAFT_54499 [Didymella exigua CBS 183.55]